MPLNLRASFIYSGGGAMCYPGVMENAVLGMTDQVSWAGKSIVVFFRSCYSIRDFPVMLLS